LVFGRKVPMALRGEEKILIAKIGVETSEKKRTESNSKTRGGLKRRKTYMNSI